MKAWAHILHCHWTPYLCAPVHSRATSVYLMMQTVEKKSARWPVSATVVTSLMSGKSLFFLMRLSTMTGVKRGASLNHTGCAESLLFQHYVPSHSPCAESTLVWHLICQKTVTQKTRSHPTGFAISLFHFVWLLKTNSTAEKPWHQKYCPQVSISRLQPNPTC